jgi:polygalacturonase
MPFHPTIFALRSQRIPQPGYIAGWVLMSAILTACGSAGAGSNAASTGATSTPTPVSDSTELGSLVTQWGIVNQPSLPSTVCATLSATIVPASNGSIDAVDSNPLASHPDAQRIQGAIDACPSGQAVKLVKGAGSASGFLSGPLKLKSGVQLWIDTGVTLYASRNPADYDNGRGDCGTATTVDTKSCNPFILADTTTGSGIVGEGMIDGRAGSLLTSGLNAGRRSFWDVAYQNKSQGLSQQNPLMLWVKGGSNFTLYRVALVNAPNFHILTSDVNGITAWGIKLLSPTMEYSVAAYACPANSTPNLVTPATCYTPDTVKNTDGFDPGRSVNVLLAYSYISVGDDDVAVKSHSARSSTNLAFLHNHFYYGHGMSIGSETDSGLSNMVVDDLTIDGYDAGTSTGLRIKSDSSRGGKVDGVTYTNVCMRNVRSPLFFDSFYRTPDSGTKYPSFTNITVRNVHMVGSARYGGGQLAFAGFKYNAIDNPMSITLDNVVLDGVSTLAAGHNNSPTPLLAAAHVTFGPGAVSFSSLITPSSSNDVTVTGTPGTSSARDCSNAFVPMRSVMPNSPI